jgi:SAM-dependent methyltransferase
MTDYDFGRHSDDYATYRPGPPASLYERLDTFAKIAGSRALDLATGPGTIAMELAARGSSVVGIDISAQLITSAIRVGYERDLIRRLQFVIARAENTGMAQNAFDIATAGQCWHWFDSDAVIAEALRVLRPGGILAMVYYTYLAEHSGVAHDTEELVLKFNPSWTMAGWSGIFSERIDELIRGGFRMVEQFCYHHDEEFSHARWRGRMRTCSGVGSGNLSASEVQRFDEALSDMLRDKYADPMVVEHRVWSVVVRKPARAA